MALVTRQEKGDLLTHQELDGNFTHLDSKISAEESARIDADTALQTAIDSEITARTTADTALDSRVSTVSTALGNRVTKVSSTDNAIVRFDGTSGEVQDSGVTIDDSGLINGSISGNAGTATKLATTRTINGVEFDGSANITIVDSTKLPKTNPSIMGSITEQVYNLTGTAISPANGTIQYKTVSANTTFTETLTSGQSVLLRLIGANGKTITFPAMTWVGKTAPVLTANCVIVLWKEQTTLYGAYVGSLV